MQTIITVKTDQHEGLYDITARVKDIAASANIKQGIVSVYVLGATAAMMIQENWDESVQRDVISFLDRIIPQGIWEHDRQDNNGAAHIKAGMIGPGETIPIINGKLGLSTWQNVFLCEFDGPRDKREIVVTLIGE